MWHVVYFCKENSVAVIPHTWYKNKTECYWPPKTLNTKISKLVETCALPTPEFSVWEVKLLGTYDKLEITQKKSKKAQMTDDLSSHSEMAKYHQKRKRKKNPKYSSEGSSDDESDDPNIYPTIRHFKTTTLNCRRSRSFSPKKSGNAFSESTKKRSLSHSPNGTRDNNINMERFSSTMAHQVLSGSGIDQSTYSSINPPPPSIAEGQNICSTNRVQTAIDQSSTSAVDRSLILSERQLSVLSDNDFKRSVLSELSHCHIKLNMLTESVASIMKSLNQHTVSNIIEKENVIAEKIPVESMTELQRLEEWLQDQTNYNIMVTQLRRVGGNTFALATRKLLYKTISNLVALHFSWDGLKKKAAFKRLRISRCILDAIKMQYASVSENDIIMVIKIWLVKAKERLQKSGESQDDPQINSGNQDDQQINMDSA